MPKKQRTATRMTPGFTGPFKGAPQQGTLFDKRALDQMPGNFEATQNRPGPRGYSPARLAEVREAWDTAVTRGPNSAPVHSPVKVEVGVNMNETGHFYGPSHYDPHADPSGPIANRARSRMLDTLARSTINVKDEMENPLAGLGHVRTYSQPRYGTPAKGEYISQGTAGIVEPSLRPAWRGGNEPTRDATIALYNYRTDSYGHPIGSNAAAKGRDPEAEQTFLHELGHHDSYIAGTESSRYETKGQQAEEEARADRFAVKHFRPDPRNPEPHDPRQHTYMARGLLGKFGDYADSYRRKMPADMRPPSREHLRGRQFEQPELDQHENIPGGREIFWGKGVEDPKLKDW